MVPGKAMAQASHASNAFIKKARDKGIDVSAWETATNQGFGTVLVLETYDFLKTKADVEYLAEWGYITDVVFDPTYPIKDGAYTHHIPLETCAYVYTNNKDDDLIKNVLGKYDLYR